MDGVIDTSLRHSVSATAFDVLQTTEMLECILQFLDISTFFHAASVCRRWHAMVKQMKATNTLMRKKLFLAPATLQEVLEPVSDSIPDHNDYLQRARRIRFRKVKLEPHVVMLNPFLHKAVEGYGWSGDLLTEILDKNDLRKQMLLTQPPLETVTWPTTFGPKKGNGTGEHGQHGEGSYLWIKTNGSVCPEGPLRGVGELVSMLERKVKMHWACSVYWKASGIRMEGEKISRRHLEDVTEGVKMDEETWNMLETYQYAAGATGREVVL